MYARTCLVHNNAEGTRLFFFVCVVSFFANVLSAQNSAINRVLPTFYRAINLNGPGIVLDGNRWEGNDAQDLVCNGKSFEKQTIPLKPRTDALRSQMIRSSRWGSSIQVGVSNVPSGVYQVLLYVWEDDRSARYEIHLNGATVVERFDSGHPGQWQRLGPWKVAVSDGRIQITASGGQANLSGLEIWQGDGEVPLPNFSGFVIKPTDEQLAFFENRIRPLLIEHCYSCHSAEAKELGGGLLLDSRQAIVLGGDTEPPIVPGEPHASLLWRAVSGKDPNLTMPPDQDLEEDQIADLAKWIEMGAPDPRTADTVRVRQSRNAIDWNKAREFWSFQPISNTMPPAVSNSSWPRNDIDRFVLAKIEAQKLAPARDADRRTLIRRATFDLIGLPPTPQEIRDFESDTRDGAFARVIDRLLQSKHYGERWGRYWLDVVRYADTAGDNSDFPIPQMYKYRNWVIDAINSDMPYDRFVTEQLAGDLLPSDSAEQKYRQIVATGYVAGARRFGSRVSDYPQHLTIEDTLDNVGRAFLGLSLNCARCHDHKFDPVTTEDYYALYGIFNSTRYPWPGIELEQRQRDLVPLASPAEIESSQQAKKARHNVLVAEVKRLEQVVEKAQQEKERSQAAEALKKAKAAVEEHSAALLTLDHAYGIVDSQRIENAAIQIKGDPNKLGHVVPRRFLQILEGQSLPPQFSGSGRWQLAGWIVDPNNPLTARVIANRVWLYHFGRGLVPTPNDFGRQGKPPTNPELLDWLASQLVKSGWSLKSLHRTIMLSRTYQMASERSEHALNVDPNNELLASFPRRRLDAEAIRDTLLMLGGNLDLSIGGEHPFPPQSEWKFTQHRPFKAVYPSNRRSVYLMTQRIQRHPYLAIFDGPDPSVSTPLRSASTTPLQALYLLNDPLVHSQANGLAQRLMNEYNHEEARLEALYEICLGRMPTADEAAAAESFFESVIKLDNGRDSDNFTKKLKAWQALVRVVFRLNEFVYID